MNWTQRGHTHLSGPYQVITAIRGYECWYQSIGKYGVLARELPTLDSAKQHCEDHARQSHQQTQLQAEFVK